MTESPETYQVGHVIDDEQMTQYVLLKSLAHKILASHRSGTLGLVKERERLIGQLQQVLEPNERK